MQPYSIFVIYALLYCETVSTLKWRESLCDANHPHYFDEQYTRLYDDEYPIL